MNYLLIAKEAKNKMETLLNTIKGEKRAFTDEEKTSYDNLKKEFENAIAMHDAEKDLEAKNKLFSEPANNGTPVVKVGDDLEAKKPFANFGEQLIAVRNASMNPNNIDKRLLEISNAASGSNTGNGAEGGFVIQSDFAGSMMDSAYQESGILSQCDVYDLSGNSNGIEWREIDETSIATSVYGGVTAYWTSEAETSSATKPTFFKQKLELEKLMGIGYATDEMIGDAAFISQLYTRAFTSAIMRELESGIISGSGIGKPLGILSGGSTVSVAKETNQTAATINHRNIIKMWLRADVRKRGSAVWLMHPDCEDQLEMMVFSGSDSNPLPMFYTPAGTLANPTETGRIKGRPVIFSDNCAALGTVGDIILANLKDYLVIRKGGIKGDESMHVRFLYGENTFRFTMRVNGMPKKKAPVTIKNSSNTRAPFVTLATRG